MNTSISPETIQIIELHKQGATVEQIAQALGKDPLVVGMLVRSKVDTSRKLTLEERYGDLKEIAINTLKDVCQFGENESARVSASKILIDEVDGNNGHGGAALNFNYEELAERVCLAKQRVDAVRLKMLEKKNNEIKPDSQLVEKLHDVVDVEFSMVN